MRARLGHSLRWALWLLALYVLSSGPVLATSCWLREATGDDRFYASFYAYWPLLMLGRNPATASLMWPLHAYIEGWFKLLGTVGPG
ncbi:hypothetical protein Pla111_06590 [Botrimarina hoheduenensis]|uniref:Uncharacterized protein n=1 Tax=Botrimarina hoheduenensis TaxID=2528000 RepID=A0A5C5WFN3_9BACT|nr:hypothetical protein Pla111_06590 [Botrimarina hoheduenensis]